MSQAETSPCDIASKRLQLHLLTPDSVHAIVEGRRLPAWAHDYPDTGDVEIARLLVSSGTPQPELVAWGHRHVIERATGLVVGGIGFFGPPDKGSVEIGYGIVPSRQGRGYATEAVNAILTHAWGFPAVKEILAGTLSENVASRRVLEKTGFSYLGTDGDELRYHLFRPT